MKRRVQRRHQPGSGQRNPAQGQALHQQTEEIFNEEQAGIPSPYRSWSSLRHL